jgi:hypothetical protein
MPDDPLESASSNRDKELADKKSGIAANHGRLRIRPSYMTIGSRTPWCLMCDSIQIGGRHLRVNY